jgi:hypothetical protein
MLFSRLEALEVEFRRPRESDWNPPKALSSALPGELSHWSIDDMVDIRRIEVTPRISPADSLLLAAAAELLLRSDAASSGVGNDDADDDDE